MYSPETQAAYNTRLDGIREAGLFKQEHFIAGAQGNRVILKDGRTVINMCANNYLGLADHPEVKAAAAAALDKWGFGMASVRFICGTQTLHKQLEDELTEFLGTEDTILYSSCFDANGGLFEPLLGAEDAIISDALNHASIIDGVRLCKAQRYRYNNSNTADLETKLNEAKAAGNKIKMIATDGVFSMDGFIAPLKEIADLADKHQALLMVDDSHSVGFLGKTGRGTHEHTGTIGRIDVITGTLGKALGGASGGYTSGRKEIVELLRQHSRPYLFSNSLAPTICAATLAVLKLLKKDTSLRDQVMDNAAYWRKGLTELGFKLQPGEHPIVPVMLGDAVLAQKFASALLENGVYAVGFFYPVVPKGQARIRTQLSAAHTKADLDQALDAFAKAKKAVGA
ncbi:MAG: glycine C-acetyltransferase [Puniceicoccales bacterium]|jgi:glycine C-acetyltransferase|nr:glycine C-acetyltransferase [Puniceicoccales bacterium]